MAEEINKPSNDATIDTNVWINAVIALTKLTQVGELRWTRVTPSTAFHNASPEGEVEFVYLAELGEPILGESAQGFRLYEEANIRPRNAFPGAIARIIGEYPSTKRIVLEIVDSSLRNLATFPQVNALQGLLSAVKYQVSNVKDVLDRIVRGANLPPNK